MSRWSCATRGSHHVAWRRPSCIRPLTPRFLYACSRCSLRVMVILNTELGGQKARAKLAEKIAARHDKMAVLIARSTA